MENIHHKTVASRGDNQEAKSKSNVAGEILNSHKKSLSQDNHKPSTPQSLDLWECGKMIEKTNLVSQKTCWKLGKDMKKVLQSDQADQNLALTQTYLQSSHSESKVPNTVNHGDGSIV